MAAHYTLSGALRALDHWYWAWGRCRQLNERTGEIASCARTLADATLIAATAEYDRYNNTGRRSPWYDIAPVDTGTDELLRYIVYPVTPRQERLSYVVDILPTVARDEATPQALPPRRPAPWWLWKRC